MITFALFVWVWNKHLQCRHRTWGNLMFLYCNYQNILSLTLSWVMVELFAFFLFASPTSVMYRQDKCFLSRQPIGVKHCLPVLANAFISSVKSILPIRYRSSFDRDCVISFGAVVHFEIRQYFDKDFPLMSTFILFEIWLGFHCTDSMAVFNLDFECKSKTILCSLPCWSMSTSHI